MCTSNYVNGTCDARSSVNGAYGFGEACNVTFSQPVTLNVRLLDTISMRHISCATNTSRHRITKPRCHTTFPYLSSTSTSQCPFRNPYQVYQFNVEPGVMASTFTSSARRLQEPDWLELECEHDFLSVDGRSSVLLPSSSPSPSPPPFTSPPQRLPSLSATTPDPLPLPAGHKFCGTQGPNGLVATSLSWSSDAYADVQSGFKICIMHAPPSSPPSPPPSPPPPSPPPPPPPSPPPPLAPLTLTNTGPCVINQVAPPLYPYPYPYPFPYP